VSTERRAPAFQVEVLTTGDCASWMGYSTQFVRNAIRQGVTAPDGTTAKLEAEATMSSLPARRRTYRIYRDNFTDFLIAIGWKRIPGQHATGHPGPASADGPRGS
jgi:hypothetical protein